MGGVTVTPAADLLTPSQVLARVAAGRQAVDGVEVELLGLAALWADMHPDIDATRAAEESRRARRSVFDDGAPDATRVDEETYAWHSLPQVAWDAPAAFAVANQMTTTAGKAMIRDALVLRHRLPAVWRVLQAGRLPAWRARRIAQAVLGEPDDVCAYVDAEAAPVADRIGVVGLDRLVDAAKLRLHVEEREQAQLEDLDQCGVTLDETTIGHTGIAEMVIHGEWADLADFHAAVRHVADALIGSDDPYADAPLGQRQARAVGILADPAAAAAFLEAASDSVDDESGDQRSVPVRTRRQVQVIIHLSEAAVLGLDPVCHDDAGRPVLDQVAREWCARLDTRVVIQPVIDLTSLTEPHQDGHGQHGRHEGTDGYTVTKRLAETIALRDRTCVFPWCTRPARRCDHDHRTPYDHDHPDGTGGDGPTCTCNVSPLCRHHHRLKTHAGWRYTEIEPGTYLWVSPHGHQLLRDPTGTRDVTSPPPLAPA